MTWIIGFALSNWKSVVAALVAGYLGYHIGYPAGHHVGWREGRAALAAETAQALKGKNDEAARARAVPCVADPKCVSDDGWRIDTGHK